MNITFRVIRIFIELYNCFMACLTVEFMIATDMPIYTTRLYFLPAVILTKNRLGNEASEHHTSSKVCGDSKAFC